MHCAGYEIYPIPQQIETKSAIVTVTPEVNLVIGEGVKEVSVTRIKEVLSQNGYAFTESAEPGDDRTNILVGENGSGDAADKFADDNTIGKSLFNAAENRFDAHTQRTYRKAPRSGATQSRDRIRQFNINP